LAYNASSGQVALTGGAAAFGQQMLLFDDYWTWNGKSWTKAGNTGLQVMGARMIFDPVQKRMLLMGGSGERSPQVGELRALVGTSWVTLGSATELKGTDPGLAYDTKRNRVVAFIPGPDGSYPKTYEWDGYKWRIGHGDGPLGHEGVSMVYDSKHGVVVAFGGHGVDKKPSADVWQYDGLKWQRLDSASGPSGRSYAGMVYDDKLGAVVIHGGMGADFNWMGDTWSWDGASWKKLSDKGPAIEMSMAYDQGRDRLVVVGSDSHANSEARLQTWEWDGTNWAKIAG
jgi:hypothetical protein